MKYILIALISLIVQNCSNTGVTSNAPLKQPTPVVTDTEYCDLAQTHLLQLKCEEGNPTKKGKSFSIVCRETQTNGIFINPKCLSQITSCDQVNTCTHSK